MRFLISILFLHLSLGLAAQHTAHPLEGRYSMLRNSFVSKNAYETVAFVEQRWRLAGNTGFNESIAYVEKILQGAGFRREINSEADAPLTYRIEKREMKKPTWEPVNASLTLEGETRPVLEFVTNRNMLAIYSASTSPEGVTAGIIDVGEGSKKDLDAQDMRNKIVLCECPARAIYRTAIEKGAAGVLSYSMPAYTQPEVHVNSIQFQGIPYENASAQKWAIILSYAAQKKIKAALARGAASATVKITTRIYAAEELTLIANVRGAIRPEERFVFSAHVQEPGANDNASGVGTLAEMARVTAELVRQQKFQPQRTLTFLWGDEIVSTRRYVQEDPERAKGIKWGLSLDMVGEDVSKTGGSFLIEKMPDPSAIWTRGKEKHTEWGGTVLKESQMFPHYFNDLLLNRCLQQGKENGWVVNTNPFEGGSDHTPFLDAQIPGLLMWHFTDVFYHTDADRLPMVSAEEMRNVGISALATAFALTTADEAIALFLVDEVSANAIQRLETEYALSREAVEKGANVKDEQHILEVWTSWYASALGTMTDIAVSGATAKIRQRIAETQSNLQNKNRVLANSLQSSRK